MNLIKKTLSRITQKGFIRNVMTLMMGTALGQLILIVSTPILTRLYSPEAFGIYGNFTALTAIITVIISLRYELTIVLPKSSSEAKKLVLLSMIIATFISLLLLFIILLFSDILIANIDLLDKEFIYFIPIYSFLVGLYQILNYWFTRVKGFNILAFSQTGRSFIIVGIQLLTGFFLVIGAYGLIVGQLFGQLFAVTLLLYFMIKSKNNQEGVTFKLNELKDLAKKYKDFPLYSSWNSFINTFSIQIPIIVITFFFSAGTAGFYMLGHRLVNMPMNLISRAISQVFLQKLAADKASEINNNNSFKLWKSLMPLSMFINSLIIIIGPWAFALVLGKEWIIAGEYARWIALWTLFQFVASPLSSISYTHNKQRLFLWFQITLLAARIIVLFIGGIMESAILAVALFSIISGLFNLITAGMYIYFEAGKKKATIATFSNIIIFTVALLFIIIL